MFFIENPDVKVTLLVVGLWTDISLRVLRLPNMEEICVEKLGGGKYTLYMRHVYTIYSK